MATRTHGLFINTVGFLYASLGFSLSVLAALVGIFIRFSSPPRARPLYSRPHLPRKLRGPRTVRSFSGQSTKVTVPQPPEYFSVETECTPDVKSLRRRSKSLVPIITIDHFESPDFLNFLPKPVLHTEASLPKLASTDGTAMDLSTISRPTIKRRSSSPFVLCHPTPLPVPSSYNSVPSRKESKSFKISLARRGKIPSTDLDHEKVTTKNNNASCFRKAGKKKSLGTLRTQPYGAPYFCMPPLPIPDRPQDTKSPP